MARPRSIKDPKTLFGKRLNYLFSGKNILDFERKYGLANGQIGKFIDGREPTRPNLEAIVKGTGCNAAWLLTGDGEPFGNTASRGQVERFVAMDTEAAPQEKNAAVFQKSEGLLPEEWRVPVQLAAKGRNTTNNGFLPDQDSGFLESVVIPKEAMLAGISGDSMSPVILSGQYAIIGPQLLDSALPQDRSIVVVEVFDNPDSESTIDSEWAGFYCKRIQQRENICYFTSINPDGDSFSVARENCRLWPVIGTLYAGHGVPPED